MLIHFAGYVNRNSTVSLKPDRTTLHMTVHINCKGHRFKARFL